MDMKKFKLTSLRDNSSGMVAIMVAVFLVLVVSLVVVNYSMLVRREQRQALDRQLNSQALYVAESGVEAIAKKLSTTPPDDEDSIKSTCGDTPYLSNGDISVEPGILEITCSLFDVNPENLEIAGVTHQPEIFPVSDAGGAAVSSITFEWGVGQFSAACNQFPSFPATSSCQAAVVRVDIVTDINNADDAFTAFLYPDNLAHPGTISLASSAGAANQGQIVPVNCTVAAGCKIEIDGLSTTIAYVRVRGIYHDFNLSVSAKSPANSPILFKNAQAVIDVTARASDVIRRIKVRRPLSGYADGGSSRAAPRAALETSQQICKIYNVVPGASNSVASSCGDF